MKCHEIEQSLVLYVDGLLSPDEKQMVEQHLNECATCRELLHTLLADDEALKDYISSKCAPPDFNQRVMAALLNESFSSPQHDSVIQRLVRFFIPKKSKPFSILYPVIPFAALLLVVIGLTSLWNQRSPAGDSFGRNQVAERDAELYMGTRIEAYTSTPKERIEQEGEFGSPSSSTELEGSEVGEPYFAGREVRRGGVAVTGGTEFIAQDGAFGYYMGDFLRYTTDTAVGQPVHASTYDPTNGTVSTGDVLRVKQ